jgi:YbgC/YbaW family acyl-CoA thioester hydrolase
VSAELAKELGPFARFEANREPMLQVIQKHQSALPHSSHALIQHAVTAWKRAWEEGSKSGFRNAQVTAIAPTGTIGLVMDCDTLGIEPEFALVKFKKLAGGGVLKIPNRSVGPALRALGYSPEQVSTIEKYIVEESTIEGAPFLQEKHLAVFDCADRNGEKGQRVLNPLAHLHMVAAVQPFVSGGISKTVNLPHSASPQNIQEIYEKAAQMGIKAISVYRSGSKLSQPLDSRADKEALTCEECGSGEAMAGKISVYSKTVDESDIDELGHVNNAKYLQFFEQARWDKLAEGGYSLEEVRKAGESAVVLEVTVRFRRELLSQEKIRIESRLVDVKSRIATLEQIIFNESGAVSCEAVFKMGFIDLNLRKLISPSPRWLRALGWLE